MAKWANGIHRGRTFARAIWPRICSPQSWRPRVATLAELTLAMVLFTDAASADFDIVRRNIGVPERLLLIGLPLTIVFGFLVATVMFPGIAPLEIALLAALLAPTDAALGKPVVTNPTVPSVMREALNIESGLNDGICVPIVVLLLGLAVGTHIEHVSGSRRLGRCGRTRDRARGRPCCDFIDHSPAALCRTSGLDQYALGGSSGRGAGGRLLRDRAGDRG